VSNEQRRQELADFLRTRRKRLSPEQVGLISGKRRRTPGLRREEVALLANIGVSWYTLLEQGRDIRVSDQVLDSIVQVMRLNDAERKHLYMLAFGHQPPPLYEPMEFVGPTLQRFLDLQGIIPTIVIGYCWDVLAWNKSGAWLFGIEQTPPEYRNVMLMSFTDLPSRKQLADWEGHAKHLLAQFRASYGKYVNDPRFNQLIERLKSISPEFNDWWEHHHVQDRRDGYKEINHPEVGRLEFKQMTLSSVVQPELKIMLHMPLPDTDTEDKIRQCLENLETQRA